MTSGRGLYRELLRLTRQLPAETRAYYQQHIRGHVVNHTDEVDSDRLAQLMQRAREDARWVLAKMTEGRAVPTLPRWVLGMATTTAWMVVSSLLIMANKRLYAGGFPYPLATTGIGQAASVVGGYALSRIARLPLRPWPPLRAFMVQVGPVVAACVGTMYWGNLAYLHLSVAFIQILKACTPAVTLVLSVAAGLDVLSAPLVLSMALIAGGTGLAVLVESGAPSFHAVGLGAFALSSVAEAARVVWSQRLMGPLKVNQAEVLSGATCVSCLVNITSYAAIATTSSLTFKVAGCVKNLAVVWLGVVVHADRVSLAQVFGYLVSMAGFALYSMTPRSSPAASKPNPILKTFKSV